jgi:hypothetical protein
MAPKEPTAAQETPSIPWLFLGGYFLFFIGLALSLVGGFESAGPRANARPSMNQTSALVLVALGIAVSAAGSLILIRSEQIRRCHFAGLLVIFVMTPIPAFLGLGINYLGAQLRKAANVTVAVILVGAGVFLLALAGSWSSAVLHGGTGARDLRPGAWPIVANLGVVALLLAATPLLFARHEAAPAVPDENAKQ